MDATRVIGAGSRQSRSPRTQLFTSLKAEMLLSLAVMGTAALSLAALNVVVLQNLVSSRNGALYLALLIVADVVIFVAFGAYKLQGLVIGPLEGVVEAGQRGKRDQPGVVTCDGADEVRRVPPSDQPALSS